MSDFDKKANDLFSTYDTNKNGALDKKEFMICFRDILESLGQDIPEGHIESLVNEGMKKYDLNGDGALQIDEFKTMLKFLIEVNGLSL